MKLIKILENDLDDLKLHMKPVQKKGKEIQNLSGVSKHREFYQTWEDKLFTKLKDAQKSMALSKAQLKKLELILATAQQRNDIDALEKAKSLIEPAKKEFLRNKFKVHKIRKAFTAFRDKKLRAGDYEGLPLAEPDLGSVDESLSLKQFLLKEDMSAYSLMSPEDKKQVERHLITVQDLMSHGADPENIKNLLVLQYDLDEHLADEIMKMSGI